MKKTFIGLTFLILASSLHANEIAYELEHKDFLEQGLSLSTVEKISDVDFSKKIAQGITVVDFFADWCKPCRNYAPIFAKVAEEWPNINFYKVNCDDATQTCTKYKVGSIPTTIIFSDGVEIGRKVGGMNEDALRQFIQNAIAK